MVLRLWDYLRIDYGGSDRSGMRYGCLGVAGDTRKQLLRHPQSPTMSPRTFPNRRQCCSGTLELPKVKIHDFSSFVQSFGVFPGCQMFRHPRMSLEIQAHNRRVGASAATPSPYQPPHVIIQAPRGQK